MQGRFWFRFLALLSAACCAAACEMGRIYGGIHFMSGNLYGLAEGAAVGDYVAQHLLGRHSGLE